MARSPLAARPPRSPPLRDDSRDERGVREPHGRDSRRSGRDVSSLRQPVPPRFRPSRETLRARRTRMRFGVAERVVDRGRTADGRGPCSRRGSTPSGREVGRERGVVVLFAREPDFARSTRACAAAKCVENRSRRSVASRTARSSSSASSGKQRLGEPCEIPPSDPGLILERVAAAVVDRAERLVRIVLVEEGARSVVDRLAADRVLSVFITPCTKPTPSQRATRSAWASHDAIEQRQRVVAGARRVGVMPFEARTRQGSSGFPVAARGKELERADTKVTRGHTGEHRPGKRPAPEAPARPVVTAASARVVGTPSAAIASLTMYSRSTGPRAARPSP